MKKPGKRPPKAAKETRGTVAPGENARKLLIDELGDVAFVDNLLMKLWIAGFKLVLVENDDE